ncbi:MAG: homoserine dehydrogenase [Bryobacterales bacterium]|nr:homoserine dehydrogenase [Bryobacterales bacterium]
MESLNVGLVGMGNVGSGTLQILLENSEQLAQKLGIPVKVRAVCSRSIQQKSLPEAAADILRVTDWRDVVNDPDIHVVAELIGGTDVARQVIESALSQGKAVVTANKELMARDGLRLWQAASAASRPLAMEASAAGGIPIHSVLREGIAGDRIDAMAGILNGTCNFILTEMEKAGRGFHDVLAEAQQLGYAEADPSADVDGLDARSKLAILATIAFGCGVPVDDILVEGIRRVSDVDFAYAAQLRHTIRLLCVARMGTEGLSLSVRPTLLPKDAILANVSGSYNAIWVKGAYGQDTFYYGRGAGPLPTGVAVVSDILHAGRELLSGRENRVSPYSFKQLTQYRAAPPESFKQPYYLRFRVENRFGIIADLAAILRDHQIGIDAVGQLPITNWRDLPFVITVEPATEGEIRAAVETMSRLDYLLEPPLVMPMLVRF